MTIGMLYNDVEVSLKRIIASTHFILSFAHTWLRAAEPGPQCVYPISGIGLIWEYFAPLPRKVYLDGKALLYIMTSSHLSFLAPPGIL
jgi:hypothetical protein